MCHRLKSAARVSIYGVGVLYTSGVYLYIILNKPFGIESCGSDTNRRKSLSRIVFNAIHVYDIRILYIYIYIYTRVALNLRRVLLFSRAKKGVGF
jgi:hypothetical protein